MAPVDTIVTLNAHPGLEDSLQIDCAWAQHVCRCPGRLDPERVQKRSVDSKGCLLLNS